MIGSSKVIALCLAAVLSAALAAGSVLAGPHSLKCKGPYQQIRGHGEIATPYCEDNYLAQIAREYGMRVSNRAVRENPNLKTEVCILVGHDIRVSHICIGHMPEDRSRRD
ncbi:MAG: hypothetical protein ACR2PO_15980 [Methyloligellaceae bacterium]